MRLLSRLASFKQAVREWVSASRLSNVPSRLLPLRRACRKRIRLVFRTVAWRWLYPSESAPISPNEVLLRAIPNTLGYFTESSNSDWAVDPYAFQPHKKRDVDGMSFFRESFTTPNRVANDNEHFAGVRVARITVGQLEELELEAIPGPLKDQLPGHVIVPAMRFIDKKLLSKDERRTTADRSQKLATFATRNGVYSPPGLSLPIPQ
jgi:hypothetical protein